MFDVVIEIVRAVLTGFIVFILHNMEREHRLSRYPGWGYIFCGFCLLFMATILDVTDNVDGLEKFVIVGDTPVQAILEKIFGYLLSSICILVGFVKFIPVFTEFNRTKSELKQELVQRSAIENSLAKSLRQTEIEKTFSDAVINSLPGVFFVFTQDLRLVRWNKVYEEKIGVSPDVQQKHLLDPVSVEDIPRVANKIEQIFLLGGSTTIEVSLRSLKGDYIPYLVTGTLMVVDNKEFLVAVGIDISEQKRLEDNLLQSQKMESIGTLAGGIAHDFNNILSAVFGYTELAIMRVDKESAIAEDLRQVHLASVRARELVKQILTFSRKQDKEQKALQISVVIKEALKLLRSSIPTTIEIRDNIETESAVLADMTQIHQMIMNLCTNAYHSMQEAGGVLAIGLTETILDQATAFDMDLPPGEYIRLEVSDTGCGMEKETREKIFEPYFTTKEVGKGTGLGLAVVHGVVKSHHGRISVYSEPGHGTTFSVYLPVIAGKNVCHEGEENGVLSTGNNEKIMVVDDDRSIRILVEKFLTGAGYQIQAFENAQEALNVFSLAPEDWALVITDQTMPKMTGAQLSEEIFKLRPAQAVILCTGYSEMIDGMKAKALGISRYMQKPITKDELLRNVFMALSGQNYIC